ncbi:transposase [Telmatocola sphagniphila]|uniref:Transposase n=1 Tax=Telmatocola sphagniphila TaxID=1123043 RepID=A0A8E6B9R2_9BACT|nr:transposase [Telmatocola sphagniphila]QVL30285.1 transposase [Telmatocola sphagniphila]QVL33879.1 transposase [Telmatocola sphagniphila]
MSGEARKKLRSQMHDFRRRPEDLKPEQVQALEDLFEKVPSLGTIYHLRWEATKIFDSAPNRAEASRLLEDWIVQARETEMDWEPFITMLKNNWEGILAYFEERKSSGPVEGLNTKIRVVLRRSYGIQSLTTLWTRILLDVNWAAKKLGPTIAEIRGFVNQIQKHFSGCYT